MDRALFVMHIIQLNLDNKKQVDDFLRLPFFVYRDIPQWVPPLLMDERLRLNPKHFPFYKHSQAAFFLASEGTHPDVSAACKKTCGRLFPFG